MQIKDILDKNKTPIFACIGTKDSFYDNTSNRIGNRLKEHGMNVVLNFDNKTMQNKLIDLETLLVKVDNPQVIALDLSYSDKYRKTGPYYCYKKGIMPGSALGCKHNSIGDVCIMIMLNAFEGINNALDAILAIGNESGNMDIIKTEEEIANSICEFYGV